MIPSSSAGFGERDLVIGGFRVLTKGKSECSISGPGPGIDSSAKFLKWIREQFNCEKSHIYINHVLLTESTPWEHVTNLTKSRERPLLTLLPYTYEGWHGLSIRVPPQTDVTSSDHNIDFDDDVVIVEKETKPTGAAAEARPSTAVVSASSSSSSSSSRVVTSTTSYTTTTTTPSSGVFARTVGWMFGGQTSSSSTSSTTAPSSVTSTPAASSIEKVSFIPCDSHARDVLSAIREKLLYVPVKDRCMILCAMESGARVNWNELEVFYHSNKGSLSPNKVIFIIASPMTQVRPLDLDSSINTQFFYYSNGVKIDFDKNERVMKNIENFLKNGSM